MPRPGLLGGFFPHSGQNAPVVPEERQGTLRRDQDRDNYFSAEEAVEYGLADRVVERHELDRPATGFKG